MIHTRGSSNPSDFLLRHPITVEEDIHSKLVEDYVCFHRSHAVPKAMTLIEIEQATARDATLQCLADLIRTRKWSQLDNPESQYKDANRTELSLFEKIHDELTVSSDSMIILRGSCIFIPSTLRERAIDIAHEGHQGLVKTKKLLRE